jgi:hypothetical protein
MATRIPSVISGRDTDLSQIGFYLRLALKDEFPINSVPQNLVDQVDQLIDRLKDAEEDIKHFILTVRNCKDHEDFMG